MDEDVDKSVDLGFEKGADGLFLCFRFCFCFCFCFLGVIGVFAMS